VQDAYVFVPATPDEIERATNVLNAQQGTRAEKLAWMTENIDQLRAECARDKQANAEGFVSRAIRYYRAHRKKPGRDSHQSFAEKDAASIKRQLGVFDD
jgi:hypothetical protein